MSPSRSHLVVLPRRSTLLGLASVLFALGGIAARADAIDLPADASIPAYQAGQTVSGRVEAQTGMNTVQAMTAAWVKAFRVFHPDFDINLVSKDRVGPEERITLGPDVGPLVEQDDTLFETTYGYEPFRVKMCLAAFVLKSHVSAIGVYVSPSNPLDQISLAKLDAIYSDARRRGHPADITTWGQLGLGGAWADKPIHAYGFFWSEDVTRYFRDMVTYGAPFKASYIVPSPLGSRTPKTAQAIMDRLGSDPYGIAFGNYSYKTDSAKSLALEDEHGVIAQPAVPDMISGRYPLQRYLYFYVNRKPGTPLPANIKEFLSFVLSRDGQDLVRKDHYLPLPARTVAEERAKLE